MAQRAAPLALALGALALGCSGPPCAGGELAPLPATARFAVVSSDYASSAIAVLDRDGALVTEAFVDSGSAVPVLVPPLSGDVVLPSGPLGPCILAVIDRFGTDVVTRFDACLGGARDQLDLGQTFNANPQDVLLLDDGSALVSRHNPNDDPGASPLERGNDLVRVDLDGGRVLSRVDLASLDSPLDPPSDVRTARARPSRLVRLVAEDQARVVIGLARLDRHFMEPGPGGLGVLDLETGRVDALPLAPLMSCEDLDAVPGAPHRAVVRCAGAPFTDEEGRRAGAGVVLVELAGDRVREVLRWAAADHQGAPVYDAASVPLGGTRVAMTAKGDLPRGVPDRVAILDLETGQHTPLFEAGSAFVIGEGAFALAAGSSEEGLLLLPDAHLGAVRRFAVTREGALELAPTETAGCRGLPPREVRRFAE